MERERTSPNASNSAFAPHRPCKKLCHLTCQELLSAEVLEEEKEGKRHRNETVELMIMSDSE